MEVASTPLPYTVLTQEDAADFIRRLSHLMDKQYASSNEAWQKLLEENLTTNEYQYFKNAQVPLTQALKDVHDRMMTLPIIDVKMAFAPRQKFINQLVDWFTAHGPGPGKLNITIDHTIIGGVVVGYDGRLHDYSLAKQLDNYGGLRTTKK